MDVEAIRNNERVKAVAGMSDNASLALLIAAVARVFTTPDQFVVLDVAVGLVLMWIAWNMRGLLQSEE